MRKHLKDVDMGLVTKYMIEHDCNIDEAVAAVKKKTGIKKRTPVKEPTTKLKAMRLKSGLSQSQLAEKADLKLRTLQAYEAGQRSFDSARIDILLRTALILDCKLEDLLENEDYIKVLEDYHEMVKSC